jgi:hypothetical protein
MICVCGAKMSYVQGDVRSYWVCPRCFQYVEDREDWPIPDPDELEVGYPPEDI